MGKVFVILRIFPEENVDLSQLEEKLKEVPGFKEARREPIGFGIEVIKAGFIVEDAEGNKVEEIVSQLEGVKEAETIEATLI